VTEEELSFIAFFVRRATMRLLSLFFACYFAFLSC
jgi:hypothetical protein